MLMPRTNLLLILAFVLVLLASCVEQTSTPAPPTPTKRPVSTPVQVPATVPYTPLVEAPLEGVIPDIPDVLVVQKRTAKKTLARYLKGTTVAQLEQINPRLPDFILPGTMIVIPPVYHGTQGETLSDIAQKTGLPKNQLRAANPKLSDQEKLESDTVLAIPTLFIVPQDSSLSNVAKTLQTNVEVLLTANPELADQDPIEAGTVLIVPPSQLENR